MKRSQIKIKLEDRVGECERELRMRRKVYMPKVEEGKMQEYEAYKRMWIIHEFKEIADLCIKKGITWQEMYAIVESHKGGRPRGHQSKLF